MEPSSINALTKPQSSTIVCAELCDLTKMEKMISPTSSATATDNIQDFFDLTKKGEFDPSDNELSQNNLIFSAEQIKEISKIINQGADPLLKEVCFDFRKR